MPRLAVLIATVALVLLPRLSCAVEAQFGSLQLDWPEGFTVRSTKPPFELAGPNGEKVLITVMRSKTDTTGEARPDEQAKMVSVGAGFLDKQARAAGKIVVPASTDTLSDGSVLNLVGSETSSLFSSGYFLQYMLVSPSGRLAFVTVEGKGNVSEQHSKVLPVISKATWQP